MFALRINPSRHYLPSVPPPVEEYLQREYPTCPLFVYFHKSTGNWVIAEWVCKDRGLAAELQVLGPYPILAGLQESMELRQRVMDPQRAQDIVKGLAARDRVAKQREVGERAVIREARDRLVRDLHPGPGYRAMLLVPGD